MAKFHKKIFFLFFSYDEIIEQNSKSFLGYLKKGDLFEALNKYDEAMKWLNKIIYMNIIFYSYEIMIKFDPYNNPCFRKLKYLSDIEFNFI